MTYKTHATGAAVQRGQHAGAGRHPHKAGLPRFLQPGVNPTRDDVLRVNRPHDRHEQEADRMAASLASAAPPQHRGPMQHPGAAPSSRVAAAIGSAGRPLDEGTRRAMEPRFGADLGGVRVHTGPQAASLNRALGANAFTEGRHIFFGAGRMPGPDALTAHEITHVLQQSGGASACDGGPVSAGPREPLLQRDLNGAFPVTLGGFEIDLRTQEGAVNTPPTHSGLDGYIRFVPDVKAPNSNEIDMIQIVKLTDLGHADVSPATLPAAQAPRGALGTPGLRTADDAARGVEGGFFTDVHHQPNAAGPAAAPGSALSPNYDFQPAAPGTVGAVGTTAQPAFYGGGIGGVVGQTPGFKRSNEAADIRSAALYDAPGVSDKSWNLDFAFESVARGADTSVIYGSVLWGFGLRAGRVTGERLSVVDAASPTFAEALERHRDFYVHEPVTFHFAFDSDALSAVEAGKIDEFLPYLTRNPGVQLSLEGFADIVGGSSAYNADLSLRRVGSVEAALLARGIPAARLSAISIGHGASTAATTNAGTGDQGGNPAVGGDQRREANRWANRRVVLTFLSAAAAGPAAAGP